MAEPQVFTSNLSDLGVIAVTGEDAVNFLHNQLTNDVMGLDEHSACLAGYCSPKGRLLATLLIWRSAEGVFLLLPSSLLPAIQKRLQMFVLRAKVRLEDRSAQLAVTGTALAAVNDSGILPDAPYQRRVLAGGTLIRVPDAAGLRRALWIGPAAELEAFTRALPTELPAAPASMWRWTDIQAGLPQVLEATREQFVPQMLNYELIGGVNFRKGCYPGQEIVARSQYLGKLKRRMLLASIDAPAVLPGTEVFSEADPDQPCGMIVNAEHGPQSTLSCLVELKLEATQSTVRLGSANGPVLTFGTLPYALDGPDATD